MKNFIVFDIMSASIRETGAWNDCKTIGAKREVHSVCVSVCVCVTPCLCAHPRAQQKHKVCSVIINSLAGVQRRYEYDCNLSPPMMERLSRIQMSTCRSQHAERAHRFKFRRLSPSDRAQS